jgi:hypothetical protein
MYISIFAPRRLLTETSADMHALIVAAAITAAKTPRPQIIQGPPTRPRIAQEGDDSQFWDVRKRELAGPLAAKAWAARQTVDSRRKYRLTGERGPAPG